MYKDKKILALIPARGGSKGIKNKNIIDLCKKPLIAYTIEAAKSCCYIDDTIISTDSEEIADVAQQYGGEVPFLRPKHLASDTAKTIDAVLDTIERLKAINRTYDLLILLQPTSPLRTSADITAAIDTFFHSNADSLVSVSPVSDSPYLIRQQEKDGTLKKLLNDSSTIRRQDMPPFYKVNGSIYINQINELCSLTSFNDNSYGFIMEASHSIDIDEPVDLWIAEYYLHHFSNTMHI